MRFALGFLVLVLVPVVLVLIWEICWNWSQMSGMHAGLYD